MKKIARLIICISICFSIISSAVVFAREGDSGYEGGISSGESPSKAPYDYQEVIFVTGQPIVFDGTLSIRKSQKQDVITSTYTYNLKNLDKGGTLTRVLTYNTKVTKKGNGQTIEETTLSGTPSETIRLGNVTYSLRGYNFTRTNIIDSKPAINYYAGNTWGRKTYQIGAGLNTGTVMVEVTGNSYGYDEYWGNTEVKTLNYFIECEEKRGQIVDKWGGKASVSLSATTTKQLKYEENAPTQISFDGGYIQTQHNNSIMEYSCNLPEFDKNGVSTSNMISASDSLKIETFPAQTRLLVPNINHLKGHWAENDVKLLYSLEVLKGDSSTFNPQQLITRAEFTAAIVEAAKEVPPDTALATTNIGSTSKNVKPVPTASPFSDVPTKHEYFSQIESAFKRGLINGKGDQTFCPNDTLTVADTLTIFIRALGLEGLAPNPVAVTNFKDNDEIPVYARSAAYVAEKIGLIQGDDKGYLKPRDKISKARAAALLNRFINYMRDGIRKDYREGIVNY